MTEKGGKPAKGWEKTAGVAAFTVGQELVRCSNRGQPVKRQPLLGIKHPADGSGQNAGEKVKEKGSGVTIQENSMPSRSGGIRRTQRAPAPWKNAASRARPRDPRRLGIAVAAQPALFCEILSCQLAAEPSFVVVGRAGNEDQIGKVLAKENPRVLIFDYEGLGPNAESTVHRLRRAAPATRILVLASRSSDEIVERILRAGASGLVGKQLELAVLVRAIRAVAAGEVWANRRVTSLALESLTGPSGRVLQSVLTKREQEIANACSQGLRNKQIALRLNISTKTVKGHLNNIFRKLRVDNRFALGLYITERIQSKS